jgi:hypothetical protein
MKYSERLVYIESIDLNGRDPSISDFDYNYALIKTALKTLLKDAKKLLDSSKKKLSTAILETDDDFRNLHTEVEELRNMYNSLCTTLLTSCAFYMNVKKDKDGNEFHVYNDHWELIPTISNILSTLIIDVIQDKEFILNENPLFETAKEVEFKTYIMRVLTWGLNTRVFMEHPDRLDGYEAKIWGEPMTDEEREELWSMNWKKTEKKKIKSLLEVMDEQSSEMKVKQEAEEKKRKEEEAKIARRAKWSSKTSTEELDWTRFRK